MLCLPKVFLGGVDIKITQERVWTQINNTLTYIVVVGMSFNAGELPIREIAF